MTVMPLARVTENTITLSYCPIQKDKSSNNADNMGAPSCVPRSLFHSSPIFYCVVKYVIKVRQRYHNSEVSANMFSQISG